MPEYTYRYGGESEASSRADRIRTHHDVIDKNGNGGPNRRDALIAGAFDRMPLRVLQAAGALVYSRF